MIVKDILSSVRDKLDDWAVPHGWEDEELLRYLNKVHREWARELRCLHDSSTEAICKIPLLANQSTYPMDARIIALESDGYTTEWPQIEIKDFGWLNDNMFRWQTQTGTPRYMLPDFETGKIRVVPYYDSEGYFTGSMAADAGTKTFTLVSAGFSTYLADGDQVDIQGTLNDGVFTVASATANSFTVDEAVQSETVSTVVKKVMDNLWLYVTRLPLTDLIITQVDTQSPEIGASYHDALVDGVLREAYLKNDVDAYNPAASKEHGATFELSKSRARSEKYRLRHSSRVLRPNPGTI